MRFRCRHIALLVTVLALLTSCMKDSDRLPQQAGSLPATCGSAGARLQATVNGGSYCASGQVTAVGDGHSVVVTGLSLSGATLIVQVDSLALGTQAITEASNDLLFMENGNTYVMLPGQTGSITITAVDTTARVLKASFSATLGNEMSGVNRAIQGDLDVIWTHAE